MPNCCSIQNAKNLRKRLLITVLIINLVMFIAQISAALLAHSTSLFADSLDMLGDALTYGISLYAVKHGGVWINKASRFKASVIIILGIIVIGEALAKIVVIDLTPNSAIMAAFALLGLIANGSCFYLLTQYRNDDVNMRSTWMCARNDMVGNVAVLIAAGLVYVTSSHWPDVIIGLCFAALLIYSAIKIFRETRN